MNGTRDALLVGCSDYEDSAFQKLRAPVQDVYALERVLADPTIGNFTVQSLLNERSGTVSEQIARFFANRKPDDLLLLYFSCHGVLDPRGRLYFVTANTRKGQLNATAISARWVKEQMEESRSQRIVLLLDCCYGGTFTKGLTPMNARVKGIVKQLDGRGRVVTVSGKREFAYGSRFTDAVVQGLKTGEADLNGDGHISVSELYQYVYDKVSQDKPDQTPTMSAGGMHGQLYLANNPRELLPLPAELEQALTSGIVWNRLSAVNGLQLLLEGDHPEGQKRTARKALALLRLDTDRGIQDDLDEVITASRDAVAATPADRPDRPVLLSNLGVALFIRFGRTGQLADLDEAITTLRVGVAAAPRDHPHRPRYLSHLGTILRARFEHTGQQTDLAALGR